nr:hypothetical protein [Rubellimicrobium rubrum]
MTNARADLASIDAVTFRNLRRWDDTARHVRVVGHTASGPGMSFITARSRDPAPFRAAIAEAIAALPKVEAEVLGLRAVVVLPLSAYERRLPPSPDVTKA